MTRGTNVLLRGHALIVTYGAEKRPGECRCGAISDQPLTAHGRRSWHREHKLSLKKVAP